MFGCLPIGPRSHSLKQRGAGRLLSSQYTLCSQYSRRKLFALTLENFRVQIFMKLCVQHAYCTCSLLIFVNIHRKQYSFSFFFPWVVLLQLAVVLWRGGVEWKPDSVKYQLTSFFPAQFSLSDYLHQPFISNTYTQHKIHKGLLMLVYLVSTPFTFFSSFLAR